MVETKFYASLDDGRVVNTYIIRNKKGEYAELMDYGAAIHALFISDKNNELSDVVLGGADMEAISGRAMEGSTIGRCANRIAYGKFQIDGREFQLECNSKGHCLHSASSNYANKLFQGEICSQNQVKFTYRDMDEIGFQCAVDVEVSYTFDDFSALQIEYRMIPHGDTVLCPTNHAYFNLSGGDVREHMLMINAERHAVKGESGVPQGETEHVGGTGLDFTRPRKIGDNLENEDSIFDDSFILNNKGYELAAQLESPETGRIMRIFTDMPCVVLYTPFCSEPKKGKNGAYYQGHPAVCLETQFVPNAVNCPQFRSPVFRKGEALYSKTSYEFSVQNL